MKCDYDVIIVGAGAAGLMCAIEAGKRGRSVWLIDHSKKLAEKIRISGGGRCNFTNLHTHPGAYLSRNPHFCKSALKQYTAADFIDLVESHNIAYHEKTLGQLFCDGSSQQIIDMLVKECDDVGVKRNMEIHVENISVNDDGGYLIKTSNNTQTCESLVIASGGLSIPKIGATSFGFDIARQFSLKIISTRAALVPLTFQSHLLERCKAMSGLSVHASVDCEGTSFSEGLLFTHRGLSGPSILQISSYWNDGEDIAINLCSDINILEKLRTTKINNPKGSVHNILSNYLPKRLAQSICDDQGINTNIAELSDKKISQLANAVNRWIITPSGTEGYKTAEVTLGGVDTNEISSKTMEVKNHKGLFFIGEVLDVTGHLGGFNFQWAWSSGYVAGQNV